MQVDPHQIAQMRALWAGVVREAVLDEWRQLHSLKAMRAGRNAEAVANRTAAARRYFESTWFVTICDFAGLRHSSRLVDAIMTLVCSDARPSFAMEQADREEAA